MTDAMETVKISKESYAWQQLEANPIGTAAELAELKAALTQSRAETAAVIERAAEIANDYVAMRINQIEVEKSKAAINIDVPQVMRWQAGKVQSESIRDAIRALATPDQTAALDAVRAEARAQGMREAAVLCADDAEFAHKKRVASETREEAANWAMIVARCDLHESRILAAIKGAKA